MSCFLFFKPRSPQRNQWDWQKISEEVRLVCCWQDIFLRPGQEKSSFLRRHFYRYKKAILKCREREKFPLISSGSFGWLSYHIDIRQIGKRKSNLILCVQETRIHERVRDSTYVRGSETKRKQ